ncbi:hypothetical protein GOP47_0008857 [Adiantum capillus-veneris]|uniref:Uncharacterized protein n=1 Tax=Adiantum capillus-veneris TaxID=13818 RepID=A0A9D4ZK42_ADICA|nr:hypothetical protein GOP47_0008857 [Adiantum capillus-veneris]
MDTLQVLGGLPWIYRGCRGQEQGEEEEEPPKGWSSSENTQGRSPSEVAIAKEESRELKGRGRYGLVKQERRSPRGSRHHCMKNGFLFCAMDK